MNYVEVVKKELVGILSSVGTWDDIENAFKRVDLGWRPDLAPGFGKPKYVKRVLDQVSDEDLVDLGWRCVNAFDTSNPLKVRPLEDALYWIEARGVCQLTRLTRNNLADTFDGKELSPRETLATTMSRFRGENAYTPYEYGEGGRVFTVGLYGISTARPSSYREVFDASGVLDWPDRRMFRFLSWLVHPEQRQGSAQRDWVGLINKCIEPDGLELAERDERMSGHPAYYVREKQRDGVAGRPKNLIFASEQGGFKPILGLADAINNDVAVLEHEETCLVYEEALTEDGLLWDELVTWWASKRGLDEDAARRSLGGRLRKALASPPEILLFDSYFKAMKPRMGSGLPALVPQVYVHYDPKTARERGDERKFLVQRMDFLLLLPKRRRVVVEVDGAQHYSKDGKPSPKVYADTVRADRELRLRGYDVYRFGGHELQGDAGKALVAAFFEELFVRHDLLPRW